MSDDGRTNGDAAQRRRLASILRDPTSYFADARRHAHEQARRFLAARLESGHVTQGN
ncbi:MAG: hypothetical protein L0H84_00260 [Pseudonocardia sp.]|nr:hypothetical protein [Pseudonocardia sp.]